MNQFCLGRTLSTPNRNVDDGVAKEIYLAKKHAEIRAMIKEERISAELGNALLLEINDYTKLNGNQTKQGFERGLTNLIATKLNDISQTATVPIY